VLVENGKGWQMQDAELIDKVVTCRDHIAQEYQFVDEPNADYLTCCKAVGRMVFVGGLEPIIKVYQ
jgi:hypothetical protein